MDESKTPYKKIEKVQIQCFALFYGIGNCSCSGGTSTRIALAILGVQSAGFALFYSAQPFTAIISSVKISSFLPTFDT